MAELRFDPEVEEKIKTKHQLTVEMIKEAVLCGADDRSGWHNDPKYGLRLFLEGTSSDGTRILVYARPIDRSDGIWDCVTAWRIP